ncbi:MAG: hypothetical protein ACJA1O_002917, partial [Spirosomataceae bacterium]
MFVKKSLFSLFIVYSTALYSFGQSVFVPLNQDYSHLVERFEIKSGELSDDFHSNVKPFERLGVIKLTERVESDVSLRLSRVDEFNLYYLQNDSWEWLKPNQMSRSNNK